MIHRCTQIRRRTALRGVVAIAGGALLAACGADTPETNTSSTPPTTTGTVNTPRPTTMATSSPATMNPSATTGMSAASNAPAMMGNLTRRISIDYWHGNGATLGGAAVKEIIKGFNDSHPTITVNERAHPDTNALLQSLQAGFAARTPPAVGQAGYANLRYVAGQFPHLTIEEAAKRDTNGNGTEWLTRNFAPNVLELGRVDGVLHGLPYGISVPVLYYNVDLLTQAGIERPAVTWAEIRIQARQITERTGKPGIYVTEATTFATQQALIESNGGRVLVGSNKDLRCAVDSPEAIEAMQLVQDMALKDKSAASMPQPQGQMAFKSGQIGMAVFYSSFAENVRQGSQFQFGTTPIPTFGSKLRKAPVGGYDLFIFATDPQQQVAAWEWIKHLNSPEAMTTFVKGSGFLPTRSRLIDDPAYLKPFFDADTLRKAAIDQLPDSVPWVSFPSKNGLEAEKELLDARTKIMGGQEVTATLQDATKRVNQLIRE